MFPAQRIDERKWLSQLLRSHQKTSTVHIPISRRSFHLRFHPWGGGMARLLVADLQVCRATTWCSLKQSQFCCGRIGELTCRSFFFEGEKNVPARGREVNCKKVVQV